MNKLESLKTCPDCNQPLREIKPFAHIESSNLPDSDIFYAEANEKRSLWLSQYKKREIVKSYICQSCGRIFMYGVSTE